jgi:adenine-specific DNA-methyltransferase
MSKNKYISSHLITYIGNKRKLVNYIEEEVLKIKHALNKNELISFDGFSGSGVVSRMLKYHSKILFVNDIEPYSNIINQCYLSNPDEAKRERIKEYISELNDLSFTTEGIICQEYSPKNTNDIQSGERAFYTRENALIIDTIRNKINDYPNDYFPYLISPLLVKASINTNTSGVFKGFHKKNDIGHFGGKDEQNTTTRITKKIILEPPIYSDQSHKCKVFFKNMDINKLIEDLSIVDIAYLDPPYNQHPYGSNYFMLNTILQNNITGDLSKVSGIPNNWKKSEYNYKKKALSSMKHLLSTIKAKYIILSYNDEGIISKSELIQCFEELDLDFNLKEIEYQTYRGSRNLQDRNNKVTEYIWILHPLYNIEEPHRLIPMHHW